MKFSLKGFFSKCDQICSFLRIWSLLLKKSLVKNFIFCAVLTVDLDNLSMLSKSFLHECFHVAFYRANVSIWELLHMSFTIFNILDNFQPLTCFIMPSPDMKMLLLYLFSAASELRFSCNIVVVFFCRYCTWFTFLWFLYCNTIDF